MSTRLTIRLDFELGRRLGAGKIALLELIEQTGSISAAGRAHQMSYRRAWLLVDELNQLFATPLVVGASWRGAGRRRRADRTRPKDRRALSRRGSEDAGGRAGGNRRHRARLASRRAGRTMRTRRARRPGAPLRSPLTPARSWPKEAAMAPIVKICGLSTSATLDAALDAGADMVGFVFFPKSPRHVDWATARALGRAGAGTGEDRRAQRRRRRRRRSSASSTPWRPTFCNCMAAKARLGSSGSASFAPARR